MSVATETGSELLTVHETAALLRLKPSTIRSWVLRRKLPYCKVGRLVRIPADAVAEFIARNTVPAREPNRVR